MPLIAVGLEPQTFSMHFVTPDLTLAATKLGRDLLLGGHRRLVAVESPGRTALTQALRQSAQRYAPDAVVDTCSPTEVATLLGDGAVAFVCESVRAAQLARAVINDNATGDVALAAIGCREEASVAPCSGYYVSPEAIAQAVAGLLTDPPPRPANLWLTCEWFDGGTMSLPEAERPARGPQIRQPMYATLAS